MRGDPIGGESVRVGRAAGGLVLAAVASGLVWGLSLAIWSSMGTGSAGDAGTLSARGWLGGLLLGLLCGAGVAVVCLIPVLLCAALSGSRLVGRRRQQRLAGVLVALLGLVVAVVGQYWIVGTWSVIAQISWPAALVALVLGAIGGPFVMEGRFGIRARAAR